MSLETSTSALKSTIEKLKNLQAERKSLLFEVEDLKKMADAKTDTLESEVKALMNEVKTLKALMFGEETQEHEPEQQNKNAEAKITQLEGETNTPKDRQRYKGSFLSLNKNPK